ncbi:F0F1 ATP synthase subunit delta [Gelidibacter japonicus]|uniref:F0F1 ATP synthase subunit delta n=1 Tax=Gelidibacter japonicus TaxID=1962232 RepID=UPI0013D109CA|nr:F0F1 ATP synthase subunit delta [Gelidibacter japonicus]MCL8007305.1 F0F1 ATP synthase subunit delta [Gelidibacter japonicus]
MEINWFTVIAQIVNFLILVWLLKRFLYKPVLDAIDAREKKIASQLEDAATKKAEAKRDKDLFRQKNETFDKERAEKMNEVHEQIDSEKQRLFEEVRKESTVLRSKFEESLKQQEQEITDRLKRKTKDAVFEIAKKTLSDLADVNLEQQVVTVFIEKIRSLDGAAKTKFIDALKNNEGSVTVKSVFELSMGSKQELEKAMEKITEKQNDFQYQLEPELVSGIKIETASYQLSWTIDSYLDALKKESIISKDK